MKLITAALGNSIVITVAFFALFPVLAPLIYAGAKAVLEGMSKAF